VEIDSHPFPKSWKAELIKRQRQAFFNSLKDVCGDMQSFFLGEQDDDDEIDFDALFIRLVVNLNELDQVESADAAKMSYIFYFSASEMKPGTNPSLSMNSVP
jgi:hypothetical protein